MQSLNIYAFIKKEGIKGVIFLAIVVACMGMIGWSGALGSWASTRLRSVLGSPPIDFLPRPQLRLALTVGSGNDHRAFSQGTMCSAGEWIVATVNLDGDAAWLAIFGWDGRIPYPLTSTSLTPELRRGVLVDRVQIQGVSKSETIYAVAASQPFSFAEVIMPALEALAAQRGEKGGGPTHPPLALPRGFVQDGGTCRRVPD